MKALFIGLALLLAGTPALAERKITINQCAMGYVTLGDNTVIGHGVDFTNNTHHVVTAIRFAFIFMTPFNEVLGSTIETDTGTFTPGVEIDHTHADTKQSLQLQLTKSYRWQVQNPAQEEISKMKVACELDAVSFQDGTVWDAPPKK
jgi:hypothetical protein